MVLGVYWYYGFPEGLYSFDYFKWKPGYGGHVNNPATLECNVIAADPDRLLQRIRMLIDEYQEGFIMVYRAENNLNISSGSFQLHDYDFLLLEKVEGILREEKVETISQVDTQEAELIRFFNKGFEPQAYPAKKVLQMVFSEKNTSNAECAMLRMDCFLPATRKAAFIAALNQMTFEENIGVLFYKECAYEGGFNLMIFFSNGRQGMKLKPLQHININRLEDKVEAALHAHGGNIKHQGGWDYYPKGEAVVVKMVDGEFILKGDQ